ncbi:HesA/MoeB/ThiF family protein [Streptomyces sp. MAR4 CNX-425]|uniref:HesA/MoeB/ThiF family protein n=1 Tax=Streptomyces sp. MAR4 CNX-425 TaxID=3406343 RepID=UPI003B515135
MSLKECLWERAGDDLVVVFDPREAVTLGDPDGRITALLTELDRAPQTPAELVDSLAARGFPVTEAEVRAGLEGLDSLGFVEITDHRAPADPQEVERQFSNLAFFGAHASLERSRRDYVRRLADAHVLVLGVGGGGSSLVQCLAGLGVGRLTLLDHDRVERRNFSRQFLYRHDDIGRSKVERAAAWVAAYDPAIRVHTVDRWVSGPEDLADLTDGVTLVAGGLDGHPDATLWVNEAAVRAGVPYVFGGAGRTQFSYASVDPGASPCLACDRAGDPDPGSTAGRAMRLTAAMPQSNPLIAPVAMQVGSLVAYEALRYLTGFEPPQAAGCRVVVDLRDGLAATRVPFTRDPGCAVCAAAPPRAARPAAPPPVAVADA